MSTPATLPTPESSSSFWHTEPSSLLLNHRTTEDLPREADVVVIGSGISGASVAHHLLQNQEGAEGNEKADGGKGVKVLVLEAREVCWGATGRNGGHCLPMFHEHPHDPSIATFELTNFHALQDLITTNSIACEFHTQPGIRALYSSSEVTIAQDAVSVLQQTNPEIGKLVKVVTAETELRELRLQTPNAVGAVVSQVAARLWPYKFVAAVFEQLLTNASTSKHINVQTNTPVTGLSATPAGSWHVTTARGTVAAAKVVLATNAYTSHLLPQYADLIVPCRGQMSALIPGPGFAGANRTTSSYGFIGPKKDDYLIQRPSEKGAHLMFGGGRSMGPSLGICDDGLVDANVAAYLRASVPELLIAEGDSEKGFKATHEWTGIMGFSRDNLPWVGAAPETRNLFVLAGYTGHGMPNAWLCGRAVATMVREDDVNVGIKKAVGDGLPRAYLFNEERVQRVRKLDTVEVQDEDHAFRAEVVAEA